MKTINDIKDNVELLAMMDRNARVESEKKYKSKIFAYYDEVKEIRDLINKLENVQDGFFSIDNFGELIYCLEVPKHIRELPDIGDYLTQGIGTYKDGLFCQFMGPHISISYNRDCYFVFDHDRNVSIITNRPVRHAHLITENQYLRAKIELYQQLKGEFCDVIVTDYYGGYHEHFNMFDSDNKTIEQLKEIIEQYEANEDEE